jgi:transposase
MPGQAERRTHDYKRHGTTSLFAALDVKAGTIISKCMPRHRAAEFRRFLHTVESNVPSDLDIHVVMDNASSHKTKLIRDWFARRPNWHPHFTPTSSSWINQVERFFALLSEQQIKRGAYGPPRSWKRPSLPMSMPATRIRNPSAGPRPPTTSWDPSSGSAAARSRSRPNVDRNFGIRTLEQIPITLVRIRLR